MGDAERSISSKKRRIAVARPISRSSRQESSPDVYTPKRRKSDNSSIDVSPPPYIPSKKTHTSPSSSRMRSSVIGDERPSTSRQDARQILNRKEQQYQQQPSKSSSDLSSKDCRELISRSRRQNILKTLGLDKNRGVADDDPETEEDNGEKPTDQDREFSKRISRQVSERGERDGGGLKNFRITARVSPTTRLSDTVKATLTKALDSNSAKEKLVKVLGNKNRAVQITVRPSSLSSSSSTTKGSISSRLGKVVVRRSSDSEKDDDGAEDQVEVVPRKEERRKRITLTSKGHRLALSFIGKELVKRQCEAAALSVKSNQVRKFEKEDSRVVENHSSDNEDEEEEEEEEEELTEEELRLAVISSLKARSINKRAKGEGVALAQNRDSSVGDVKSRGKSEEVKKNENEEGEEDKKSEDRNSEEDLDVMLRDDVEVDEVLDDTLATDEFTLDLEDDDLIKVVGQLEREEALVTAKESSESNSSTVDGPGTRFIVTLDGVDEKQFEGRRAEEAYPTPSAAVASTSAYSSQVPATSLPVLPQPTSAQYSQQPTAFVKPQNPVVSKILPHGAVKPAPPRIQPFSINLRDSDEELDDRMYHHTAPTVSSVPASPYLQHYSAQQAVVDQNVLYQHSLQQQSPTEVMPVLQRAKISERCKFWPACAAGSECEFHHPNTVCKTFPSCKFGDKCLFIHPNCKFDSKCTRVDCPFTHTSKRSATAVGVGVNPGLVSHQSIVKQTSYGTNAQYIPFSASDVGHAPSSQSLPVCKFFPNCHNVNCVFVHPKLCRFGLACQNALCTFSHPSPPAKDKLKWTSHHIPTAATTTTELYLKKEVPVQPQTQAQIVTSTKPKPTVARVGAVSSTST